MCQKELENFKFFLEFPKNYVSEYFRGLKNEVDLSLIVIESNQLNDQDQNKKMKELWLQIIAKIDSFEQECLKKCESLKNEPTMTEMSSKLKACHLNNEQLEIEKNQLEVYLFSNKTQIFLNNSNCDNSLLRPNGEPKLLFLMDEFLSKEDIESLKNK